MVQKRCSVCRRQKALRLYHKHRRNKDGVSSTCKNCARKRALLWADMNKDRHKKNMREWRFVTRYGINVEDYERMLTAQDGKCALCYSTPAAKKHLDVDHCHTTGTVRGLLCRRCNMALGLFKDNARVLSAAVRYLKKRTRR